MRLGLYHTCLIDLAPEELFDWMQGHGFSDLELHGGGRYTAIDWGKVAAGDDRLRRAAESRGIKIWDIMDGSVNFLDPDADRKRTHVEHTRTLIRAAKVLGAQSVSVFTGRDPGLSLEANLDALPAAMAPVVAEAEDLGIRLCLENCPMAHEWPPRFNIAVHPGLWRQIFERIPSPALGLAFDPSHLVWQGIDYVAAATDFGSRIVLAQAKDSERLPAVIRRQGILDMGFWRHRIPGQGEVEWGRLLSALAEAGYRGPLFIEQEDPFYEGSQARAEAGIAATRRHLEPYLSITDEQ
ncbi:MAG: sugar phosphate isomerase/epimerase [Thermaerobacter sp.]|nr:sugar phosphate isomerase/epimerase [Thermaerobacter sp.]